jgi:hypothetical protein
MTPSLCQDPFFESLTQKKLNFEVIRIGQLYDYFSKRSGIFLLGRKQGKVKLDYKRIRTDRAFVFNDLDLND